MPVEQVFSATKTWRLPVAKFFDSQKVIAILNPNHLLLTICWWHSDLFFGEKISMVWSPPIHFFSRQLPGFFEHVLPVNFQGLVKSMFFFTGETHPTWRIGSPHSLGLSHAKAAVFEVPLRSPNHKPPPKASFWWVVKCCKDHPQMVGLWHWVYHIPFTSMYLIYYDLVPNSQSIQWLKKLQFLKISTQWIRPVGFTRLFILYRRTGT